MTTIGERIRLLRKEHNLTQDQLAKLIDKTKSNVSGYENDKFEPSAQTIISLCNFFDVSADFLLFGINNDVLKIEHKEDLELVHNEIDLVKKINRLDNYERAKVEGIVDGLLMAKELSQNKKSSNSNHGEEAATNETA